MGSRWNRAFWLTLGGAILLAYFPALDGSFVWDDVIILMLAKKSFAYFWVSPHQPDYWPVTYSVLYALWNLFGMKGLGYHLVNLALHLANGALLFALLGRLGLERARPLAVALFLLHPMQVETVAYIFQLKTLLGATFFLAAALFYLQAREEKSAGRFAAALGLTFLALFTKTSTAMLPATLLLLELARARAATAAELKAFFKEQGRALAVRLFPFAVIAAAGVLITLRFNQQNYVRQAIWSAGPLERVLTAAWNLWFYVYKLVIPLGYAVQYEKVSMPPSALSSYLPLLAFFLALGALWRWRRVLDGALFVGAAFFFLNLFPALGFTNVFFMKYALVADHWAYLSTLGLLTPLAVGLTRLPPKFLPAPLILCALLGVATWRHSRAFEDEETLWQTTLAAQPRSSLGHTSLALLRYAKGRYSEALEHYQKAVEYGPDVDDAHYGLGRTRQELGDMAGAEQSYRRALALNPLHGKSLNGLGVMLSARKEHAEAVPLLEKAVELEPDYYEARNNLALAYGDLGRHDEALAQLKVAAQLRPDSADVYVNLGSAYLRMKKVAEAKTALERALELNPRQALAHFNLAVLYEENLKDKARAIAAWEAGLALSPNPQAQKRLDALRAGAP